MSVIDPLLRWSDPWPCPPPVALVVGATLLFPTNDDVDAALG
jgi:hypothetical protein